MRLSNLADYAVITMCQAALHCGNGRVSAAELATETGLPVPTVQKLVSKLTAAGLLRSVRGAHGGIELLAAGAPGGPELHEDDLSSQVPEVDLAAVDRGERELNGQL